MIAPKLRNIGLGRWRVETYWPNGRVYATIEVRGGRQEAMRRGRWAIAKARGEVKKEEEGLRREAREALKELDNAGREWHDRVVGPGDRALAPSERRTRRASEKRFSRVILAQHLFRKS